MAEDTPGLLLLAVPFPHPGCSRCSVAWRRDSSLHVFCVLLLSAKHSDTPLQLPLVSIPISCFSSLNFQHYCSASRTASTAGTCCCPYLLIKPVALTTSLVVLGLFSGFLIVSLFTLLLWLALWDISECICFCPFLPALPPPRVGTLRGPALFCCFSIVSVCLWAASNLYHVLRFWNIFRVGIFFLCSVAFSKGSLGSYTHSNCMTLIFVQNDEHVSRSCFSVMVFKAISY